MNISFSNPWGLLLLAALPLFWLIARPGLRYMRPLRRGLTISLRLLIIALIVISFSGIQSVRAVNNLAVVFLLDRSDSVAGDAQSQQLTFLNRALAQLDPSDRAAIVTFGEEAVVERPLAPPTPLVEIRSRPRSYYSDLAGAIRLATALFPADAQKRIVVISDGNENVGAATTAASLAASSGIGFSAVTVGQARSDEIQVDDLTAPPNVREGEQFNLTINVNSTRRSEARLVIYNGERVVRTVPVNLNVGRNIFRQPVEVDEKGLATFRVQVQPVEGSAGSDTTPQNNSYSAFTFVAGKPSVLVVSNSGEPRALIGGLRLAGIEVRSVEADKTPADVQRLASYDAVVLHNVPYDVLPQGTGEAIQSYVRDLGRGLVVIGGDESFALGGYFRTPLEEALPINMNLPNRLSEANTAVMLVIDHSGSMAELSGTTEKMALANEAAKQAVVNLGVDDAIGVIAFDHEYYTVVRLRPVDDAPAIQRQIDTISVAGGTDMWPALNDALDTLTEAAAKSKTIILLTDGVSSPGDIDALIRRAKDAGVTITTIGVGETIDAETLGIIARSTTGRFYQTRSGSDLPKIFTKETRMAARSYLNERSFSPQVVGVSPILQGLVGSSGLPKLDGYVGSSIKPLASLVLASDNGDPILAAWQYGLGRAVAWTSDARGQWSTAWLDWTSFSTFWSQAVRWTMPGQAATSLQPLVAVQGNSGHLQVDAVASGGYLNDLNMTASIVGPGGITATMPLRQSAPGRYEADFPLQGEGVYLVGVRADGIVNSSVTVSGTTVQRSASFSETQTLGLAVPYSPEYRNTAANDGLLRRLISLGLPNLQAGVASQQLLNVSDDPAPLAAHNLKAAASSRDLWPYTLAVAILLLPFDVGVRRISVGLNQLEAWFNRRRRQPVAVGVTGGNALFAARDRARSRTRSEQPLNLQPNFAPTPLDESGTIAPANQPTANSEAMSSHLLRNKQTRRDRD